MDLLHFTPIVRAFVREYFIDAQCDSEKEMGNAAAELFAFLREKDAHPVNFRLFVKNELFNAAKKAWRDFFEYLQCPVVWISQPDKATIPALSFQVHAIGGVNVQPIFDDGQKVGCQFQDGNTTYFFLCALAAPNSMDRFDLAGAVFGKMQRLLQSTGVDFSRTLRTWLFADDILSWYDKLNMARDNFFHQHDIFNKLVPASTGVGIANPLGLVLAAELLAVQPLNSHVQVRKIVSPLQCEALDYQSSFSRGVHIQTPDHSRMYVSGTASIAPDGKTAYVDDCAKQIELTMQVVEALINNGQMDWSNSMRAIAYFKDSRDFGLFDDYCRSVGLDLPHIKIEADVCRDDLLFELELDLLSLSAPNSSPV